MVDRKRESWFPFWIFLYHTLTSFKSLWGSMQSLNYQNITCWIEVKSSSSSTTTGKILKELKSKTRSPRLHLVTDIMYFFSLSVTFSMPFWLNGQSHFFSNNLTTLMASTCSITELWHWPFEFQMDLKKDSSRAICVNGQNIKRVDQFIYLGSIGFCRQWH